MAPNIQNDDPLGAFTKLSSSIYIHEPEDSKNNINKSKNAPTIVVAFWMNAPLRALAKYVLGYRRLAPAARIIFILSSSIDILRSSTRAQHARLSPAIHVLRDWLPTCDAPIHLHMFSNGGSSPPSTSSPHITRQRAIDCVSHP
ncbi:hypothetical protein EYZ11_009786 [Aspergillus tanneri]|uniref:Uncharacterized protein n=1 Tax=Aspergillus tanneri TaxID=1220188 RepID=A0A4S3J7H8_9EURO|nr:hypothetical protein EYZ11_009786 [Aspergillus tanneri]